MRNVDPQGYFGASRAPCGVSKVITIIPKLPQMDRNMINKMIAKRFRRGLALVNLSS